MKYLPLTILPCLLLAACGGGGDEPQDGGGDGRTATGEVLEGSISDAMIPLDQVKSIEVDQGKLAGKMLITFVDGSSVDFDIVKTSGPGPFAEKFTELTGR